LVSSGDRIFEGSAHAVPGSPPSSLGGMVPSGLAIMDPSPPPLTSKPYFQYYGRSRTHFSLAKDAPEERAGQPPELGPVIALAEVGGLHHRYERRAA
jgi:hypothetical protein